MQAHPVCKDGEALGYSTANWCFFFWTIRRSRSAIRVGNFHHHHHPISGTLIIEQKIEDVIHWMIRISDLLT